MMLILIKFKNIRNNAMYFNSHIHVYNQKNTKNMNGNTKHQNQNRGSL